MSTLYGSEPGVEPAVHQPADGRVFAAAVAAALLTDLAVRSGANCVAGTLLVVAVSGGLLASGRLRTGQARAMAAAAVAFGLCLTVRTSPWLLPLDVAAVAGLLVLAASVARGGSVLDLPFPSAAMRGVHAVGHGLAGTAFLAAPLGQRRSAAVLRGAALAVPLLVVLGLLLGSADAVFAGFFDWWSPLSVIAHAALLGVGAWGMAGLLRLASAADAPRPAPRLAWRVEAVEATVVLGSLVALFGAFAAAQLYALSSGGRHVLRTAGLTYAEYARNGFFQLLAVAAITLVALLGLRAVTDLGDRRAQRRFTVLAEVTVGLTLVVVAVALRRLALYEHAFGLTMLRLYSSIFAVWIGVVVALAGLAIAGLGRRRAWLPAAAVSTGLVLLLALNVVNPEAVVARHNVDRAARTQQVDPAYLAELSDDAVPALVDALPRLPEPARDQVMEAACRSSDRSFTGWAATNTSRRQADDARRRVCRLPQ